jgi:putative peptidoglycan lipid II flippase
MVIPLPMVSVLFERGATKADDSAAIALAVAIYGLGLPAFVLQKVLQPLFFAREDTRTPFRYAVWSMVVNAVLAIGLVPLMGWIAPAVATTAAGWVMVVMLAVGGRRIGEVARFDARFRRRVPRIIAASLAMGAILWGTYLLLAPFLIMDYWRYLALLLLLAMGLVSYGVAGHAFGAFRLSEFSSAFRRGRS